MWDRNMRRPLPLGEEALDEVGKEEEGPPHFGPDKQLYGYLPNGLFQGAGWEPILRPEQGCVEEVPKFGFVWRHGTLYECRSGPGVEIPKDIPHQLPFLCDVTFAGPEAGDQRLTHRVVA